MAGDQQPSRLVAQLVAALGVLADAPKGQLEWLARYLREGRARTEGDFPVEELALQLEDAAQALPHFVADGLLLKAQESAVAKVTEQLSRMRDASRTHLWRADALSTAAEWAEVREWARRALTALEGQAPPA
jgi:hypothetical protein